MTYNCVHHCSSLSVPRFPSSPLRRCVKQSSDEQRAKAREHQKKWREKLKQNATKSTEYKEMQKERTRIWKEKLRCDEQKYEEVSKKHQESCKKWWEKLTPEQRREKRRQYNMKWRQNQKKGDDSGSSVADPKEMVEICMDIHPPTCHSHHPYKAYNEVLMENEAANKTQSHFYSKSKFLPYSIRNWI